MRLGMGEMLIVLVVALLVFGPNKLPQLGDALGKGIRNFKKAAEGGDEASASSQAQLPAAHPQLPSARADGPVAREAEQVRKA